MLGYVVGYTVFAVGFFLFLRVLVRLSGNNVPVAQSLKTTLIWVLLFVSIEYFLHVVHLL